MVMHSNEAEDLAYLIAAIAPGSTEPFVLPVTDGWTISITCEPKYFDLALRGPAGVWAFAEVLRNGPFPELLVAWTAFGMRELKDVVMTARQAA